MASNFHLPAVESLSSALSDFHKDKLTSILPRLQDDLDVVGVLHHFTQHGMLDSAESCDIQRGHTDRERAVTLVHKLLAKEDKGYYVLLKVLKDHCRRLYALCMCCIWP